MIFPLILSALLQSSSPPQFAFKEFRGNGIYTESSLRAAGCREPKTGRFVCSRKDTMAGSWALIQYLITDQRLTYLHVTGLRPAIPEVLAQLRGKYGEPCDSKIGRVTNRFGGTFANTIITWCFRSGNLVFQERDTRADSYSLTYRSFDRPAPESEPPADF